MKLSYSTCSIDRILLIVVFNIMMITLQSNNLLLMKCFSVHILLVLIEFSYLIPKAFLHFFLFVMKIQLSQQSGDDLTGK